jgi:ABC-type multidrug transport system fused ATPase/permease subunit
MTSGPLSKLRQFFASRFSLSDNVLWRVMKLLRPMRRRVILANCLLILASALTGAALVSLYPLFSVTFGSVKEAGSPEPEAIPDDDTSSNNLIIQYAEQWEWFRDARESFNRRKQDVEAWMHGSTQRFVVIWIGFILVLYLLMGCCQFAGNYLMGEVSANVISDLMRRLYAHILRQEMVFFDHNSSGSLLNICYREVFQLQGLIPMLASRRVLLPVTMLIYFVALLIISYKLSLLLLVLLPVVVVPSMLVTRKLRKSLAREIGNEAGVLDVMSQGLQGIQAIKAFNAEKLEAEQLDPCIDEYLRFTRKRRIAQAFIGPMIDLLNMIVLLIVFVLALSVFPELYRTDKGRLMAFLITITRFYKPMRSIMTMNIQMQRAQMVARRIFRLLDRQPAILDAPDALPMPRDWRALHFDDVSLVYTIPRRKGRLLDRTALEGVRFTLHRGETVALVGPNGAGKSSIVKLTCRFYEPTSGVIRFDDVPLNRIRLDDLRDQICLITQHPVLFNRPVSENIAFGLESLTREQIETAARAVRAHDFISRMPQGYDTLVGEGGKLLSGGERQKIVLARAFVRLPSLLIFDEPTAGLDRDSVAELIAVIDDLRARGISIIWITHAHEHLAHVDRILELTADRKIVEVPPH